MDKEAFYDYYGKLYYWKNSIYVEKEIIKILYKGHPIEKKGLIKILAWKMRRIDQTLWVYGHCNNIKYCEVS